MRCCRGRCKLTLPRSGSKRRMEVLSNCMVAPHTACLPEGRRSIASANRPSWLCSSQRPRSTPCRRTTEGRGDRTCRRGAPTPPLSGRFCLMGGSSSGTWGHSQPSLPATQTRPVHGAGVRSERTAPRLRTRRPEPRAPPQQPPRSGPGTTPVTFLEKAMY